jgi:hypothetical protein
LRKKGFPGFGTVPDALVPLLPKSHPTLRPSSGKHENAQVADGKRFPGGCGRRKAWLSHLTRSATSYGAWGTPAGVRAEKLSIPPTGLGRRNEPFALLQVDVKDILDQGALGAKLSDHIRKKGLPRYQWTFLEG